MPLPLPLPLPLPMPFPMPSPLPKRSKARACRGVLHGALALILLCSNGAEAMTLDALLRLPLERLLQLQVAVRGVVLPAARASDGGRHVVER